MLGRVSGRGPTRGEPSILRLCYRMSVLRYGPRGFRWLF
jgi:hypothetical protein